MKQMEQQNVKYDPQIRKLQKERYADQGTISQKNSLRRNLTLLRRICDGKCV